MLPQKPIDIFAYIDDSLQFVGWQADFLDGFGPLLKGAAGQMVPAILGVGILELFDDVTIERVLPGEQIDPHSDDVFDIFVIGMAGDR